MTLVYGSVCSGIEAASVAWEPLGWRPSFLSEIEKFPRAVLKHHFPHVPLHGDFTTIEAGQYDPIDLLVGGTPCQDFSIAGLRAGLSGERGNLTLEYLRLARRLRPRWLVWENVPGVLSQDGGRAFGAILGGMVELGYGVAYRVLDAQHFGVPQRRRRVFVVGYLGDWRRAGAVLFERHSLQGNPPPRREAGAGSAVGALAGTSPGGGWRVGSDEAAAGQIIAFDTTQMTNPNNRSNPQPGDPVHGLSARAHPPAIAYPINSNALRGDTRALTPSKDAAGVERLRDPGLGIGADGDPADTLQAAGPGAVAYRVTGNDGAYETGDAVGALQTGTDRSAQVMLHQSGVRRLTPRECERLQGLPDDWTAIPGAKDGPRYKALGNSMAVVVMRWLGERIQMVEDLPGI